MEGIRLSGCGWRRETGDKRLVRPPPDVWMWMDYCECVGREWKWFWGVAAGCIEKIVDGITICVVIDDDKR